MSARAAVVAVLAVAALAGCGHGHGHGAYAGTVYGHPGCYQTSAGDGRTATFACADGTWTYTYTGELVSR